MKINAPKKSPPALFQLKTESFWRICEEFMVMTMVLVSIIFIFFVLTGCTMNVNKTDEIISPPPSESVQP